MNINLNLYFDRFLLERTLLRQLQRLLAQTAGSWAAGLHVFVEGEATIPINIRTDDSLQGAIGIEVQRRGESFAAPERRFGGSSDRVSGRAELRGSDPSVTIVVQVDERVVTRAGDDFRWANRIAIQVRGPHVDGLDSVLWTRNVFESCAKFLTPTFGYAATLEEYDSKNTIRDDKGTHAFGVDLANGLPGVYWLNAYGRPYIKLLEAEKLLSVPAPTTRLLGGTIVIVLAEDARAWNSAAYQATEKAVLAHLGQEHFIDKSSPDKTLRSIDLSAYLR